MPPPLPLSWLAGVRGEAFPTVPATTSVPPSPKTKLDVHDFHATILHLLGLDHEQLTYHYSGRDYRLTDVAGRVVDDIVC